MALKGKVFICSLYTNGNLQMIAERFFLPVEIMISVSDFFANDIALFNPLKEFLEPSSGTKILFNLFTI